MMRRSLFLSILALVHCLGGSVQGNPHSEGIRVLSSDSSGIVIEFTLPPPSLRELEAEGELYQDISLPGLAMTGEAGKPNLPVMGTLIGLPEGSSPTLSIIETEVQVLKGVNLRPAPQAVMVDEDTRQARLTYRFTKDAEAYGRNAFLPKRLAELGSPAYMRDQQVAQVRIFPVRYNPVTMEVQYHSRIVLHIDYGSTILETGAPAKMSPKTLGVAASGRDNPFDVILKNLLLNYDEVR